MIFLFLNYQQALEFANTKVLMQFIAYSNTLYLVRALNSHGNEFANFSKKHFRIYISLRTVMKLIILPSPGLSHGIASLYQCSHSN